MNLFYPNDLHLTPYHLLSMGLLGLVAPGDLGEEKESLFASGPSWKIKPNCTTAEGPTTVKVRKER